jgi:hypothetical protein
MGPGISGAVPGELSRPANGDASSPTGSNLITPRRAGHVVRQVEDDLGLLARGGIVVARQS